MQAEEGMQRNNAVNFLNHQQPHHCWVFCRYHEKGCRSLPKFSKLTGLPNLQKALLMLNEHQLRVSENVHVWKCNKWVASGPSEGAIWLF